MMKYAIITLKKEKERQEENESIIGIKGMCSDSPDLTRNKIEQLQLAITCLELVENGFDPFENGAFIWEGYKKN